MIFIFSLKIILFIEFFKKDVPLTNEEPDIADDNNDKIEYGN